MWQSTAPIFRKTKYESFRVNIANPTVGGLILVSGNYGQSYKHFTLVNFDSRVVIYERWGFIWLATG